MVSAIAALAAALARCGARDHPDFQLHLEIGVDHLLAGADELAARDVALQDLDLLGEDIELPCVDVVLIDRRTDRHHREENRQQRKHRRTILAGQASHGCTTSIDPN